MFSLTMERGFIYLPCQRDHEYWRQRLVQYSFLPALRRYFQRRIDDLFD